MIPIENKDTRPDWNAIRAEYISGVSSRKLAEKYGVSRTCILRKCKAEQWTKSRDEARAKATEKAIQKTADVAADNATIAASIKRKGLLMLDRLFDDFARHTATEHRESADGVTDIKRLRDLTAAYKDLTEDMQAGGNATNDLLQSLLDLEQGARR